MQNIEIGQVYRQLFTFQAQQVRAFAELSGDQNPIHLDENYAAESVFKRPIVHGVLVLGVFSKIFGSHFPGEGTIYVSQKLEFLRPVYVGDEYEAIAELLSIEPRRKLGTFSTQIFNVKTKKITFRGESVLQNERVF
jgi:acyl dehydratase